MNAANAISKVNGKCSLATSIKIPCERGLDVLLHGIKSKCRKLFDVLVAFIRLLIETI